MDLVSGPSLEERLREGPLPEREVLRLGAQLARGLLAAHEQGVVHRDLKPSNLHLTPDGLLKILDFGLARLLQPDLAPPGQTTATETAAGAILGSPPYMAPEQLLGRPPDERTDVYSAGAVLYELATGWVHVAWMGLDAEDRPLVTIATAPQKPTVYALDWETP